MRTRIHTHIQLVSLNQSRVSPETSWKLDVISIYPQRTRNQKDNQLPDLPLSMALFLPQFLCPRSQEFRSPTPNLSSGERNLAGHLICTQELVLYKKSQRCLPWLRMTLLQYLPRSQNFASLSSEKENHIPSTAVLRENSDLYKPHSKLLPYLSQYSS